MQYIILLMIRYCQEIETGAEWHQIYHINGPVARVNIMTINKVALLATTTQGMESGSSLV